MRKILISAGHSNLDPGACNGTITESGLVLDLRDRIINTIVAKQGVAGLYRDGKQGDNKTLKDAIAIAKSVDLAIEFHFNAGSLSANGTEVLAKPAKKDIAKELAFIIQTSLGTKLRGDNGWKLDTSGQHPRLGFCEAGGLIVEIAFISNQQDLDKYKKGKDKLVFNLAEYFINYMGN